MPTYPYDGAAKNSILGRGRLHSQIRRNDRARRPWRVRRYPACDRSAAPMRAVGRAFGVGDMAPLPWSDTRRGYMIGLTEDPTSSSRLTRRTGWWDRACPPSAWCLSASCSIKPRCAPLRDPLGSGEHRC